MCILHVTSRGLKSGWFLWGVVFLTFQGSITHAHEVCTSKMDRWTLKTVCHPITQPCMLTCLLPYNPAGVHQQDEPE